MKMKKIFTLLLLFAIITISILSFGRARNFIIAESNTKNEDEDGPIEKHELHEKFIA